MVKRGALLGATLMFIGGLFITLGYRGDRVIFTFFFYGITLMAIIGISGYLKRLITNIFNIFSEEEPSPSKKIASPRGPSLPAAYSAPVADSGRQLTDTGKMAQPSSVIEQTTSRLNNI
jgi:hypothetical protein